MAGDIPKGGKVLRHLKGKITGVGVYPLDDVAERAIVLPGQDLTCFIEDSSTLLKQRDLAISAKQMLDRLVVSSCPSTG